MIVGKRKSTLALLFSMRGSVLPHILPRILAVMAVSIVVVVVDAHIYPLQHAGSSAFAVFGIALSLFLGFRNNAAYERWWEGRKLWGQLVADTRALAREAELFLDAPEARERLVRLTLGFLHLHRLNLRRLPPDEAARQWADEAHFKAPHPPCAALNAMAKLLREERQAGRLDGFGAKALDERLTSIGLAQAGCERIATTPLPFVYSLLVYRTSILYCLLVPLGLIEASGWLTPLFVAVIAYVFFGLAEVTEELENPFGTTVNGLALDAMCRTVEISLLPHIGLPAPAPRQPVDSYLS
ncbi:bestrophin family protein [Tropicibacter naphthalenivorans]|uniref:Putative membrane protein n=1 Tax=Tropicibacter naphthalenivorans TaxID=441103 RepID=A0A0P1G3I0_9RHOB|nr:bestrophin family ion channel [Tropicibacter naphthalenivorans]CUH76368.1 putative membrane protein [Tropicibacter naphthalenivorans]SMC66386.1 putative membrane protein [Tropicibacter naphthalenivorans]